MHQADDVDLKRILSTSDKPVNVGHLLASPALWEYKQSLTISRVKTLLDSLPREVNYLQCEHVLDSSVSE